MRTLFLTRRWSSRVGPIRVRGVPTLAGGRYVSLAFLWGRRWRSLRGTIRENGAPEWAGGAMRSRLPFSPFLRSSSLYPPSACVFSHPSPACIVAYPS